MNFNKHSEIRGTHSLLSPSQYHWINYDDGKIEEKVSKYEAALRGTRLHAFASDCISLGQKLPRTKKTLNMFVNDAIGFRMSTEQPLYFSENCYGSTDAISFNKNMLRISDYKSGVSPASFIQLKIYMALFCHEYDIDPRKIDNELGIYQNDDLNVCSADAEEILEYINRIKRFDAIINKKKTEGP